MTAAELVLRKVSMDWRTVGKMATYSVVEKEVLMGQPMVAQREKRSGKMVDWTAAQMDTWRDNMMVVMMVERTAAQMDVMKVARLDTYGVALRVALRVSNAVGWLAALMDHVMDTEMAEMMVSRTAPQTAVMKVA